MYDKENLYLILLKQIYIIIEKNEMLIIIIYSIYEIK